LLVALAMPLLAAACDDEGPTGTDRIPVVGSVADVQPSTQLRFYNEDLLELDGFGVQVRQDGTFGPLAFEAGSYFGTGTASGFTTGLFVPFDVATSADTVEVEFDLDPITVPLAVGNRWTYEEVIFEPAPDTLSLVVEVVGQQAGQGVPAVFEVEERRSDPSTGGGEETTTFFLAQDAQGIRKSLDATIDSADELLLRLPASLRLSWTTADFATGAQLQKRIVALACDENGCVERDDFTIAVEPAGTFMAVTELHALPGGGQQATVFTDIGIVDGFVQDAADELVSQRKLVSFSEAL
jgi:hypothetical protein